MTSIGPAVNEVRCLADDGGTPWIVVGSAPIIVRTHPIDVRTEGSVADTRWIVVSTRGNERSARENDVRTRPDDVSVAGNEMHAAHAVAREAADDVPVDRSTKGLSRTAGHFHPPTGRAPEARAVPSDVHPCRRWETTERCTTIHAAPGRCP